MELTSIRLQVRPRRRRFRAAANTIFDRLWQWFERNRQRRALLRLDTRMLKDIGISRCDAEQEASKWFFQE